MEKAFLSAGIAVIIITNIIGALQHSAGWLFGGIVVGLTFCAYSHIIGNRSNTR
jgi:hypothetical protein